MTKKALFRLTFSLCLLAAVIVGFSRSANACPRAVTIKYYAWVEADNPGFYHWCTYPQGISPAPPPGFFVWQQIGQESTDCDANYSTWGDITNCTDSSNIVRTSTACTCQQ
jgi:hypothetical protein